jgi:ribosomal-protein-alanine N-acetyltransferase
MAGSRAYFLRTERLGFDCWSAADLGLARELWGDPKVTELIGGPFNDEQIVERLGREIACMTAHRVQYWPIFLLESGRHAGCAGLRPHGVEGGVYELGFHLRPECWGLGLAEEAGRALVKFGFENIGARALFAGHHPQNAASARVLSKLGFRFTHEEFYGPTRLLHRCYLLERPG